jgi:hypothetical protein
VTKGMVIKPHLSNKEQKHVVLEGLTGGTTLGKSQLEGR